MDISQIPVELGHLKPYLLRGGELRKHDPIITYYCYYYAVQQALEIKNRSKESNGFLFKLMDELEGLKKELTGNECISNESVGYSYFENFALKIFLKADNEDRSGNASKKTAMTFLAASVFLQVLKGFQSNQDESAEETDDKIRYAKWKAADIAKAIREGRTPTAGPPVDAEENQLNDGMSSLNVSGQTSQAPEAQPLIPTQGLPKSPVKSSTPTPVQQQATTSSYTSQGLLYDPLLLEQAQKYSRYAISALQYEDLKTAADNLEKALNLIKTLANK